MPRLRCTLVAGIAAACALHTAGPPSARTQDAVGIEAASPPRNPAAKKRTPLEIGTSRQLLFDDQLTDAKTGFVTTMNPAIRGEKPALLPEKPWESYGIWCWVTVMKDDGIYKMWYDAYSEDRAGKRNYVARLCYATSPDGRNWVRPSLGVVEFNGSKQNNIVFEGLGGTGVVLDGIHHPSFLAMGTVFKDPTAGRDRRFKYMFTDSHGPFRGYSSIYGAYSADGIHWTASKLEPIIRDRENGIPWYSDIMNVCFWDERILKYVAYVRWDEPLEYRDGKWAYHRPFKYRAIARSEGDDFENLPKPAMIMAPDQDDPPGMDLYDSAAIKYPFAAGAYFMFPSAFHHTPDTLEVQLAASRDGVRFTRWRTPFVRLGSAGAFDSMEIYMGVGMLAVGDEIWMYYGGFNVGHRRSDPGRGMGGIGMVRIRLDGFVSQDAPDSGGSLTTTPLRFAGDLLQVNMDGSAGGSLKVEILGEDGQPIPGFGAEDADTLYGNDIRKPVTWRGRGELSALRGRTLRLRFAGRAVKLYAFQFTAG